MNILLASGQHSPGPGKPIVEGYKKHNNYLAYSVIGKNIGTLNDF